MQSLETYIKMCFAALATMVTTILGGWDIALQVLIILIAADYFTGLLKGFFGKKLSSCIGARGIVKKVLLLVVVALAAQVDKLIGDEAVIRTAVIYFYVANEGLSILENLTIIGVPFPKPLKDRLLQLRGDDKE